MVISAQEVDRYQRLLALIAELRIEYADGSIETIITDESWRYRRSFTTLSDIYNGETQDYSQPLGAWKQAIAIDAPSKLCQRYSPLLHYMETLPVKEIIHTPAGETVLNFGQNFAGHVVCTQTIPKGVTMTWEFGEILQNGNFYHDNYRTAESKSPVFPMANIEISPQFYLLWLPLCEGKRFGKCGRIMFRRSRHLFRDGADRLYPHRERENQQAFL